MNLFNKSVRKASEQLRVGTPGRNKKDKDTIYKCYYCKGDINKDASYYQELNNNNLYHTKCLTCHQCKQDCSSEFYFTFKKIKNHYLPIIYCKNDMNEICHYCSEPILNNGLITFLNMKFHEEHFKCFDCQELLSTKAQVYEFKKRLYCPKHFITEYHKDKENQLIFNNNYNNNNTNNDDSYYNDNLEEDEDDYDDDDYLHYYNDTKAIDEDYHYDNLIIDEFNNNDDDYSAKYCAGCNTMLLIVNNIKILEFKNQNKSREFWHSDCFKLFKKYKIILNPQFIEPKKFIIFNKNSNNMNINSDLKTISNKLNDYYNKVDTSSNNINLFLSNRDKSKLFANLLNLLNEIQLLFNSIQKILFIIDDYQNVIKTFPYDEKFKDLSKLNFIKFKSIKDNHLKIFTLFNDLLTKNNFNEFQLTNFNNDLLKVIDHLIGYIFHKILIYNYLTKNNYLLNLFLDNLNHKLDNDNFKNLTDFQDIEQHEETRELFKEIFKDEVDELSSEINDIDLIDQSYSSINSNESQYLNHHTSSIISHEYLDPICSKCLKDIKLESFIFQLILNSTSNHQKILRFHMDCSDVTNLSKSYDIPRIVDVYGNPEESLNYNNNNSNNREDILIRTEYVSSYDQVIDSTRRILKRWYSKQFDQQITSPILT